MKKAIILFESVLLCLFILTIFSTKAAYAELYMSISGTVKDVDKGKGIAGVEVVANGKSMGKVYYVKTANNGNFVIQFVLADNYDLFIRPLSGYIESRSSLEVTVEKGKNIVGLNINLEKAGSVSGKVYQKDGVTPISGVSIIAYKSDDNVVSGTTNNNGEYTISGLKETDAAIVFALPNGYAAMSQNNISIKKGQMTTGVNFIIDQNIATGVQGRSIGPDGSNNANAMVIFYSDKSTGKTLTDTKGNFIIGGLAPGIYSAVVIDQANNAYKQSAVQIVDNNIATVNFDASNLYLDQQTASVLSAVGVNDFSSHKLVTMKGFSSSSISMATVGGDTSRYGICSDYSGIVNSLCKKIVDTACGFSYGASAYCCDVDRLGCLGRINTDDPCFEIKEAYCYSDYVRCMGKIKE